MNMKIMLGLFISLSYFVPIHADNRLNKYKDLEVEVVTNPKLCATEGCKGCTDDRLTNKLAFVVDTSSSIWGVFPKVRKAFIEATSHPSDELEFSTYVFNQKNNERYRDWAWASIDEFKAVDDWISKKEQHGVLSYGARAIEWAITGWAPIINKYGIITGEGVFKTKTPLTVVIITDGGFSENRRTNSILEIETTIERAQQWRERKGYPRALIATIGIENRYYRAGGKRSDKECQKDLQTIGIKGCGGYYYLRKKRL